MYEKQRLIEEIQRNYGFNKIKIFEIKRLAILNRVFKVETERGVFFGKTVDSRKEKHISKVLELIDFLYSKNYPAVKVIKTKENNNYIKIGDKIFILFEWIDIEERWNLSLEEYYEMGKYLALLHKLTERKFIDLKSENHMDLNAAKNMFNELKGIIEKAPRESLKEAILKLEEIIRSIKIPKSLPKSILHNEFTPEHVRFKNGKLIKVIDFDDATYDYCFYDIGTSLASCLVSKKQLDWKIINSFLEGYEEVRRLKKWEKEHIYESIIFGVSKFVLWGLEDIETWTWDLDYFKLSENLFD